MPWHDVGVAVEGPAARDVARSTFQLFSFSTFQQAPHPKVAVPLKSTLCAAHLVEKQRLQMVRLHVLHRYLVCLITGGGLGALGGGGDGE